MLRFRIMVGSALNLGLVVDRGTVMTRWIRAGRWPGNRALVLSVFVLLLAIAAIGRCAHWRREYLGDVLDLQNENVAVKPDAAVSFTGRVVDGETGASIKGALVVVERRLPGIPPEIHPAWVGQTTMTTGDDGRFVLKFPADQVVERRLAISLRVAHPDYIPCKSTAAVALVEMQLGRRARDEPFFGEVRLKKGVEYSGQIETPEGKPAAGVPFELTHFGVDGNPSEHFVDDTVGKTDSDGRFRLRMPRSHQVALYVTPSNCAPFQRFWGVDEPRNSRMFGFRATSAGWSFHPEFNFRDA
jgi:hypothetical protein